MCAYLCEHSECLCVCVCAVFFIKIALKSLYRHGGSGASTTKLSVMGEALPVLCISCAVDRAITDCSAHSCMCARRADAHMHE